MMAEAGKSNTGNTGNTGSASSKGKKQAPADARRADATPARVMIAEDQPIVRQALSELLALEPGITVVASAADGEEAIQRARAFKPDVVLMDIQMPRLDGIAATRRVLAELPATKIIVLTTFDTDDKVFAAISAGATGYLLKDAEVAEIVAAIRAAMRDEPHLSPEIARKIVTEFRRIRPGSPGSDVGAVASEALNERENAILALIAEGRSNAEIATALALAEGTVKNYVSRILEKLHLKNRTELATRALRGQIK